MEKPLTIKAIKERLTLIEDAQDSFILELKKDERKAVQQALSSWEKKQEKALKLKERAYELLAYERQFLAQGYQLIAGIDEVGRGPLAGPVVSAAVILPPGLELPGVDDSKKLSEKRRGELVSLIEEHALAIGVGVMDEAVIDEVNIYQATKLAMVQAVQNLKIQPDFLLIDAMPLPEAGIPFESIIKGDAKSTSIGAASIIAKEIRDQMMKDYDQQYPGYDFASNAGYGTKKHLDGLEKLGITPIHRKTFAPIKDMI
ncbi:ribonuclease HII [Vagococcus coleopterorum]|uniref:Ribonuclease HII n=1 Tax=Vagococcus coleopterorum TaxID=2714946 RepID=A0A6G8ANB4_9ENTE|nr:ribonuclease HII [Vagococcus coleopterorum]QIL46571.1 ribonuclease HII [Vagococcus coleopterorum]